MIAPSQQNPSRADLQARLAEADIVPLLMVLVQFTGDVDLLEEAAPHITGPWDYTQSVPPALAERIVERLAKVLEDYGAGRRALPAVPPADLLQRMIDVSLGGESAVDYTPLFRSELAIAAGAPLPTAPWRDVPDQDKAAHPVLIIGAGLSGVAAAIQLKAAGLPFTVIEKNPSVGGTWFENRYPDCGVDTPNHVYSYSFAPNPDWSHHYSKRDEIWAYLKRCVQTYGLAGDIRLRTEVVRAVFDEAEGRWDVTVRSPDGGTETLQARAVISAVGQLNRPLMPDIPGLEDFDGPVLHTARWDPDIDLTGRKVAMIGTGASGMQAGPPIAGIAESLTVFQRSPHWATSSPNYHRAVSDGKKWALRHVPFYANWYRFQLFWASGDRLHPFLQVDPDWPTPDRSLNAANEAQRLELIDYIKGEIGDRPDLLAKVVPPYPPYGKRMLRDNYWYRMLTRPNVTLVAQGVQRVLPGAVVSATGEAHAADALVLATGFDARRMLYPMDIRGRGGVGLRDVWGDDDPRAYLGITTPGFPNFFMLYGPNTNLAHGGTALFHIECQVAYILQAVKALIARDAAWLEVKPRVHDAYNARVDDAHSRMVWTHPGVGSWYKNRAGRITANSPWRVIDYWDMTQRFEPDDYLWSPQALPVTS